jgi:hypothetical protein
MLMNTEVSIVNFALVGWYNKKFFYVITIMLTSRHVAAVKARRQTFYTRCGALSWTYPTVCSGKSSSKRISVPFARHERRAPEYYDVSMTLSRMS